VRFVVDSVVLAQFFNPVLRVPPVRIVDRDSVVGVATGYELDGLGMESRDAYVQTGPGTHLASYTVDTESFPG
jgi:hypothetical protein